MSTKDLQKLTKNVGVTLSKHSPTILTALGVAGLIATCFKVGEATPLALDLIEIEREKNREEHWDNQLDGGTFTKMDYVKITWKCYIPALVMGGVTVGCIVGANSINLRRNAAMASLYSLTEVALKEYKSKVIETIGKPKEREISDSIAKDRITKNPMLEECVIHTGKGEQLCYDALSGRYFKSDIEYIRKALNEVGRNMLTEDTVTLNDVYYALDLRGTKLGDLLGWRIDDGLLEADFSSQLTDGGIPCLVLDFTTMVDMI